jgi:hypothetical protein
MEWKRPKTGIQFRKAKIVQQHGETRQKAQANTY